MKIFLILAITLFTLTQRVWAEEDHGENAPPTITTFFDTVSKDKFSESIIYRASQAYLKAFTNIYTPELKKRFGETNNFTSPEGRKLLLDVLTELNDQGKVLPFLYQIKSGLKLANKLPAILDGEKGDEALKKIADSIDAQFRYRGLSKYSKGKIEYEEWQKMADRLHKDVDSKLAALEMPKESNYFEDEKFWGLFNLETHSEASLGNQIEIKIDGVESFKKRDQMIESATQSINILSWSFEDDATGKKYADKLIAKAKEGVAVRIMVDGQTANLKGYRDELARMEAAGIEIVRWNSANDARKYDGQHRKFTVIDGKEFIGGGMNYGDVYSHNEGKSPVRWRDTDVYAKGPIANDASRLFASLWNEQQKTGQHKNARPLAVPQSSTRSGMQAQGSMQIIDQDPAATEGKNESIMKANLYLIKAAKNEIIIENAYFISDPVIQRALEEKLAQGVKVKILTNSGESIDVPEIANPILKSTNALLEKGAEIYLKSGKDTLHTKALQVDSQAGWIGSWNMHPRSHRVEGESIYLSRDAKFNRELSEMLKNDMSKANAQKAPAKIQDSPLGVIFETYGYDLL